MDVSFLFYVFLSFVIGSGGTYILYSSGRIVVAILYLVGVIAIESYFGSRWFSGTQVNVTFGAWPPSINVCPDMLSLNKNGTTPVCVDTVGVAPSGARGSRPLRGDTVLRRGSGRGNGAVAGFGDADFRVRAKAWPRPNPSHVHLVEMLVTGSYGPRVSPSRSGCTASSSPNSARPYLRGLRHCRQRRMGQSRHQPRHCDLRRREHPALLA